MAFKKSSNLMMIADSFYIPKYGDGDEAHFFCKSAQIIGVADGGGGWGWTRSGAGDFARELMRNAEHEANECNPDDVDPTKVLHQAFHNTAAMGSSTACLISLSGDTLRAANVGDSGFLIIREGKTFYKSHVQRHRINKNLYRYPDRISQVAAEEVAVEVEGGDFIIAGTDGLFGNLVNEEIERIVDDYYDGCSDMDSLSMALATAAHRKSHRRKFDDITVVVAHVVRDSWSYEDFLDLHLRSSFF